MRDLGIDEDFDYPIEVDEEYKEDLIVEIILSGRFDMYDVEYEELYEIISDSLDKAFDYFTHTNGKVYIEDWSEFEEYTESEIEKKLENLIKELKSDFLGVNLVLILAKREEFLGGYSINFQQQLKR